MGKLDIVRKGLTVLSRKALAKMGPKGMKLYKHAPAILTGVGIVGMVGGTVLACKATMKTSDILDEWELMNAFGSDDLSEDEVRHESNKMVADIVKSYIPTVVVDVVSIGCIVGGAQMSHKRLLTAGSIAATTAANFASYRNRVRESEGEEKDLIYLNGGVESEVVERKTTKKGNVKEVKKKVVIPDPNGRDQYAFQFKKGDAGWHADPQNTLFFMQNVERTLNRRLKTQGYVFLHELYDELGIRDNGVWYVTAYGQTCGWFDDGTEDKWISLGVDYESEIVPWNWNNEDYIWIMPNVDGYILDKI